MSATLLPPLEGFFLLPLLMLLLLPPLLLRVLQHCRDRWQPARPPRPPALCASMLMRRVLQQCRFRRTLRVVAVLAPVLVLPLAVRSCTCQSRLRGSLVLKPGLLRALPKLLLLQSLQPKETGKGTGIGTGQALLLACGCPGSTAWSARPRSCRPGCLAHLALRVTGQALRPLEQLD